MKRHAPWVGLLFVLFVYLTSYAWGAMPMARPIPTADINQLYLYGELFDGYVHHGVDFPVAVGTPVYAAMTGTVVGFVTGQSNTYPDGPYSLGNYVRVESLHEGHTIYTLYAHLSTVSVDEDDTVTAGTTIIGLSGNSGYSSGPHLHFEIQQDNIGADYSRNPELYMEPKESNSGAVAGFVPNASPGTHVTIEPNPKSSIGFQWATIYNSGVASHDDYQENYAIGDLPAGTYTVTCGENYSRVVTVAPQSIVDADFIDPHNILENGSFEYGITPPSGGYRNLSAINTDISRWTVSEGNIDWINTYWVASDGDLSIDLVGTVAGKIEQSFSTNIGQRYTVTFDMAGNPVTYHGITSLRIEAAGQYADFSFDNTGMTTSNMGWETKSWSFTANDTTTTLSFRSLGDYNRSGPAIDNVAIDVYTNEPGPCAGTAAASTYNASPVYPSSGLGKHLAYILLPIGAVIALRFWRRKR